MNKENHKAITREALKETGLKGTAIEFIAMANQDSDHMSAGASMAEQHFCGSGREGKDKGPLVVAQCNSFIDEVLEIAALLTRRSNPEEITDALYYVGRAFHCVQDFYAHSNWIALKNKETWHGLASPYNLKFCNATSLLKNMDLQNTPWYNKRTFLYRKEKMKKTYEEIITSGVSVCHPDMHLDYKGSWGDDAISYGAKIGGAGAFNLAFDLARKSTLRQWINFLGKVREDRYKPTSSIAVAKWEKYKSRLKYKTRYRGRYNEAGCDANMAIMNLKDHDPGKIDRVGMENSRMIFNDYFEIKSKGITPLVGLIDQLGGKFDAAIF